MVPPANDPAANPTTASEPPWLVLLDLSDGAPSAELRALWERSGFLARLAELGGPARVWDPSGGADVVGLARTRDVAELEAAAGACGARSVVLVEPDQVFLDPEKVRAGLATFDPARLDSFTQWEHCRLPVGVGVRALALRTLAELGAPSPAAALDALRARPAGRRFGYDVHNRVPRAESLLDARATPALRALLERCGEPATWGLAGFLRLVQQHTCAEEREALAYRPAARAPRVDERRMPAPYGFESWECADFPTYVMFDVTNVCNARCVHCPQSLVGPGGGRAAFLGAKEHQSLEAFRRVVDECAGRPLDLLRVTADGEPLVHPQLFEMLEYAAAKGVGPVALTTNASLLDEARARRLLASGVALVDFSLDAARPETFETIRVGLSFEKTRRNVLRFLELRAELGAPVRVLVSFVKQAANAGEREEFEAYWGPRVDEVLVREMISNVGLNEPSETHFPGWDARWPCAHFFRRVVVNHQGVLKACPIDWEQKTANRPVAEQSVRDQWHGDWYWSHRMQHLNDAFEPDSACRTCPDWAGTPWELGYEKVAARMAAPERRVG